MDNELAPSDAAPAASPISHPSIQLHTDRPSGGREPLRYGVILDSESIAPWQIDVIEKLVGSGNARLVGFLLPERSSAPKRFSLREFFSSILYYLARLTFWNPRFFRHRPLPKRWSVLGRFRFRVERRGKYSDYIVPEDVERLKDIQLDFILKFGLRILRGDALKAAKYGVWSFHHGDERQVRGRPAGFWEIYHGLPTTGVILQRLTSRLDGGVILKRGVFATLPHSYVGSLARLYRQSADFPALVCSDILRGDAPYLEAPPSSTDAPIYRNPTNVQTLVCLARILGSRIRRILYGAFSLKVWGIGLIQGPIGSVLKPETRPPVQWLASRSKSGFVADPFLVSGSNGRTWLFYEHLDYGTLRGRIGCAEVGAGPIDVDAQAALVDAHHLSFPCAFRHEGQIYCVPEEASARRVRLYRFDEGRRTLEEIATLLPDIRAIDPAVFQHGGLWWIACTDNEMGNGRLLLWHARDLTGPYAPHPGNPVKIDVRNARSAGRPFVLDGKTYRPSQDYSQGYGRRVNVHEILTLDTKRFEERPVATVAPFDEAYGQGLHQLSSAGEWTVVDGYRNVFHPLAWYFRLKSVVKNAMR